MDMDVMTTKVAIKTDCNLLLLLNIPHTRKQYISLLLHWLCSTGVV